jgi:hypothetical protein
MYLRNVILVAVVFAMASFAQITVPVTPTAIAPASLDGPIQVHYFANPLIGDSYINVTNDGYNGDELLGPGAGAAGNICVNVYAFDATDEQEVACCSCLITPNAVSSLKVSTIMLKTLTGFTPASSTIKLVATQPVGGFGATTCSASGLESQTLADGMLAWGTTLTPGIASGAYVTVETAFLPVSLGTNNGPATGNNDLASLAERCSAIVGNGSGNGQCSGCTVGALGASKL